MTEPLGTPQRITLHWTAGNNTTNFADYHACVRGDGTYVKTRPLTEKGAHTWFRNSGNIGLAFDGEMNAHPAPDGHGGYKPVGSPFPIPTIAIETMAKAVAELCLTHSIPLHGVIAQPEYRRVGKGTPDDTLIATGHNCLVPTVTDHRWYAVQDQYPDERWDIADLLPEVIGKAAWYLEKLHSGEQHLQYTI